MRHLTVLYDSNCGLCQRTRSWLAGEPKYVDLVLIPANSDEAFYRFPDLDHSGTLKDMTAIADDGAVYRGDRAWLTILWTLRRYRDWSLRLATPELLPMTRKVVTMISQNRRNFDGAVKLFLGEPG